MRLFIETGSWTMTSMGFIYTAMGMVYLKRIRDQKRRAYIELLSNFEVSGGFAPPRLNIRNDWN